MDRSSTDHENDLESFKEVTCKIDADICRVEGLDGIGTGDGLATHFWTWYSAADRAVIVPACSSP